jgi:hypothetical protein
MSLCRVRRGNHHELRAIYDQLRTSSRHEWRRIRRARSQSSSRIRGLRLFLKAVQPENVIGAPLRRVEATEREADPDLRPKSPWFRRFMPQSPRSASIRSTGRYCVADERGIGFAGHCNNVGMMRLRRKLKSAPRSPPVIRTVRGFSRLSATPVEPF